MSDHLTQAADELANLRQLSARVGSDLLLTQGSNGNSSIKIDGVLWIKASGKWMADAMSRNDVLIPLDLADINRSIMQGMDPAGEHAQASIETAMHAMLPHRVVVHLHDVNAIAWGVRKDAPAQLARLLHGLNWHWIPYVASGLPLAREVRRAVPVASKYDVLVLGNHGLVIAAENCQAVEDLLSTLKQRLSITPRPCPFANLPALACLAEAISWTLPRHPHVHALAVDPISQAILSGGLLHPGQSIFAERVTRDFFCPVRGTSEYLSEWAHRYQVRPFLIVKDQGVLIRASMSPAQQHMLSGLAEVVQRIGPHVPIHYLTEEEVATSYMVLGNRASSSI